MVKDLKYDQLFEEYKSLLTEKQQEVFYLYYRLDLSLGEIKEIKNISRQGVLDTVNKVCKLLDEYEEKLHLLYKKNQVLSKLEKLDDAKLKEEIIKIL